MAAPPSFEAEIAISLGVDLGIEVVLLGPERVRWIEVFKILYQKRAVKLSISTIAGESRGPTAAQKPARVTQGMLTAHPRPIGKRRSGNDDWAEQFGPNGRQHHDGPAGLAIPDHAWLSVGFGMQINDLLNENRFSARDVLNGLAGHRLRQKADEIARMPGSERDAD